MAKLTKSRTRRVASKSLAPIAPAQLLNDLRALIGDSRQRIAQAVNSALVLLYWQVGQRIRTDILKAKARRLRQRNSARTECTIGNRV